MSFADDPVNRSLVPQRERVFELGYVLLHVVSAGLNVLFWCWWCWWFSGSVGGAVVVLVVLVVLVPW